MKNIRCKDYETLSKKVANSIIKQITLKPNSVLGLATGSTPIGTYQALIEAYQKGKVDFSQVTVFNLDEYYPISKDNPQSYHHFMMQHFFQHININKDNCYIPNGQAKNIEKECRLYDEAIKQSGGIDLQLLGIGTNGHIGFNEPGRLLHMNTHLTSLKASTIEDNARFFDKIDSVPTKAITMGIGSIMKAKKILLLVSGQKKADIYKKLFEKQLSTDIPVSLLQLHLDVTVMVDQEAYSSEVISDTIVG